MRTSLSTTLGGIVLLAVTPSMVMAQTERGHLGPHVSYNFDAEEFGIGVQGSVPIARRLEFYPSFDYYFVDPGSLWAINADLKYRVATAPSLEWLYVGGGLSVTRFSNGGSDTEAGLNLLAGAESLRGRVHPFGEGRLTIGDESRFQIAAGLNITLGRP